MNQPVAWVHVHDVHPDQVGVETTSWPVGEVYVYLGSLVQWRGHPEDIRAVVAEIDRQLPTRSDAEGVLARFDDWQAQGLGTVTSLRLAAGVGQ